MKRPASNINRHNKSVNRQHAATATPAERHSEKEGAHAPCKQLHLHPSKVRLHLHLPLLLLPPACRPACLVWESAELDPGSSTRCLQCEQHFFMRPALVCP